MEIRKKNSCTYTKIESVGNPIMSDQFLKKTVKKWDEKEKNLEKQEENDSKIEKEYQERKRKVAKQLEKDMKRFKKGLDTK